MTRFVHTRVRSGSCLEAQHIHTANPGGMELHFNGTMASKAMYLDNRCTRAVLLLRNVHDRTKLLAGAHRPQTNLHHQYNQLGPGLRRSIHTWLVGSTGLIQCHPLPGLHRGDPGPHALPSTALRTPRQVSSAHCCGSLRTRSTEQRVRLATWHACIKLMRRKNDPLQSGGLYISEATLVGRSVLYLTVAWMVYKEVTFEGHVEIKMQDTQKKNNPHKA